MSEYPSINLADLYQQLQLAAATGDIAYAYEEREDAVLAAAPAANTQDVPLPRMMEWLKVFSLLSNLSLEGPASITLQLYEQQGPMFDEALSKLEPEEQLSINEFLAAIAEPSLSRNDIVETVAPIEALIVSTHSADGFPCLAYFDIGQALDDSRVRRYVGTLTLQSTTGDVVGAYNATTGGFIANFKRTNGPTPPGYFVVSNYRRRSEKWATRGAIGFTFDLDEVTRTGSRGAFRIHPDGPPAGTHGCVGIVEDGARLQDCAQQINALLGHVGRFRLLVRYGALATS